jgi:hypothetical protein
MMHCEARFAGLKWGNAFAGMSDAGIVGRGGADALHGKEAEHKYCFLQTT